MEMEYLCEFVVVAQLCSFSKAAEELNISQSSLSKHIMALEKELDVRLFQRTSRSVALSEAGIKLLPLGERAQSLYAEIKSAASEHSRRERGTLTIISIPVMAHYDITGVIAGFSALHPSLSLSVAECESSEIFQRLRSGAADLAFVRKNSDTDVEFKVFFEDRLVAVLPKSHQLAGRALIRLDQLKDEDFLFLDQNTDIYAMCVDLCRRAGFEPKVRYTGHRPENIIGLVSRNMGVSLLMRRHAEYTKNLGVVCVDVSPTVESEICLAKMAGQRLSGPAKAFWETIDTQLSARPTQEFLQISPSSPPK